MQDWLKEELQGFDAGDQRLNERFELIMRRLSDKPTMSIPAACNSWNETLATYRFFDNASVSPEQILSPHREATVRRIAQHPVVVVAQDTTTLNLTKPSDQMKGTGPLSDEHNHGMFNHVGLAISTDGVALGVVEAEYWARDWETFFSNKQLTKSEKAIKRRETPFLEKESARWLRGYQAGCELAQQNPQTQIVVVSDSEADLLDCIAYAQQSKASASSSADWITRAYQDRCLPKGETHPKLWDACEAAPVRTTIEIEVSENDPESGDKTKRNQSRTARTTQAEVRAITITLPGQPRVEGNIGPQVVNVVYVREIKPPEGEKPVEWLLLTNLPIDSIEEIQLVIDYYVLRWKIELYFRILKVGCGVEKLQFEQLERYQRCLAVYMVVAWRVFYVMMLGRECPEIPCDCVFSPEEWKSVYKVVHRKEPPKTPPPLGEMVVLVAKLGGYLGRKHDGPPGPQTTWIGMQRMKDFALAWLLFQSPPTDESAASNETPRQKTAEAIYV